MLKTSLTNVDEKGVGGAADGLKMFTPLKEKEMRRSSRIAQGAVIDTGQG